MFPFVLLGGAALLYFLVKGSSGEKITVANGVASNAGMDLLTAQRALQKLGYSVGSYGADNRYGEGTKGGLLDFQKANALSLTGIVDLGTARLLAAVVPPGGFPAAGGKPASGGSQPEVEPEGVDADYPPGVVDGSGVYIVEEFDDGVSASWTKEYELGRACAWGSGAPTAHGLVPWEVAMMAEAEGCANGLTDNEDFRAGFRDVWEEKENMYGVDLV